MRHTQIMSLFLIGSFIALPMASFAGTLKDTQITTEVKTKILTHEHHTFKDATGISVHTHEGKVQLCGFVSNQETSDMAEAEAKKESKEVVNNIIVK